MLDYKLPYHVIEEDEEDTYIPKLSFKTYEEAKEFIMFCPNPNLIIVKTSELKRYFLSIKNEHDY
ncbi:MAG: hypothetical protein H6612_07375 [Ignavibacteriales bacterium]|nr:hypothetical protein [Ignavibacteriales bacterium]MCB9259166.1 hypothetical protein [Ignavibacteriales bacterium]